MALKIPTDFDVFAEQLDDSERFIRDSLRLDIENWARFRYTINVGNRAENLRSNTSIADEVKESYRELAKSHYEVVTSLGAARIALDQAVQVHGHHLLLFGKALKDFYFHIGCLLDNLARLVFIINDPDSAAKTYSGGRRRGLLVRHWIGWGSLPDYPGYTRLKRSKQLGEIRNIRNNITHSWSCPITIDSGVFFWPLAARKGRDHLWFYDERPVMRRRYRRWLPLLQMMKEDLSFVEALQNNVFSKLVRDVVIFEHNHGVEIQ